MISDPLVTCNEDVEHLRLGEAINASLDSLAARLGQGQGVDNARSKPLDKFVVLLFHEGAGTYDNDMFGGTCLVGCNACLE